MDLYENHIVFKIDGGTGKSTGISLCRSCRNALIAKGFGGEIIVECSNMEGKLTFDVSECTRYVDKSKTSLMNMQDTAWILLSKEHNKPIGFVTPDKWQKIKRDENK